MLAGAAGCAAAAGGSDRVQLQGALQVQNSIDPDDAHAGYRLLNTGGEQSGAGTSGVSYSTIDDWLLSGSSSDYEVRATVLSGAVTSGTTGSWLALSTSRSWEVVETVSGNSETVELNVEIRDASSFNVLVSATVNLSAVVNI